jgi:carbon monoxide dehydrogenase subunit G
MPIEFSHEEIVSSTPERAFAVVDDLPLTSKWLPPCVSLGKIGEGPNEVGDELRYVYVQGGRQSEMAGRILARLPGERLHCKYFDKMFEVSVDLQIAASPGGTRTTHVVAITPKTLIGRLMGPIIRIGLRKQTRDAARNLRELLESAVAQ